MNKLAEAAKLAMARGLVRKAQLAKVPVPSSNSARVPIRVREVRSKFGPGTMPFNPGPKMRAIAARPTPALTANSGVSEPVRGAR